MTAAHPPRQNRGYLITRKVGDGYHRIGLLWTREKYTFYVDDEEVWETRKAVSHRPEYPILSVEAGADVDLLSF